MASTVLSGTGSVSYANNVTPAQNVRVIINYMANPTSMSWSGASVSATNVFAIGRNLAFNSGLVSTGGVLAGYTAAISSNNMCMTSANEAVEAALPTEIMLAAGQTFSATCGAYNVIVIPEAG